MKNKLSKLNILTFILYPAMLVLVLLWLFTSLSNLQSGNDIEGKKQLEQAVKRASISCYAIEGSYPPSLDYLIDNYGIQIDKSKYVVYYQAQAQNLMPDITVLEVGD